MKLPPKITIIENFKDLKDPRVERTKRHKLIDIVTIAICAVICGADGWIGIETYGKAKQKWLKQFLELPNGIPSHDTFSRVFARIDPIEFQNCFLKWINSIKNITKGSVIAIDGKTLKHSYDKGGEKGAIHMVSAWATANRLVLGQRKVEEKSNEITAIPELIKVLDIAGCLVTIDAMGCQREIVKLIAEKEGDYIITLKKNQKTLYKNVEELFQKAIATGCLGLNKSEYHTREENHGREEIRHYLMLSNIGEIIDPEGKWKNIKSVGMAEYIRKVNGQTKVETRYYISSIEGDAKLFGQSVQSHWGIENSLHWILDVAFREDDCRIRKDNSPQNLAVIRHIAVNLVGQEKSQKLGVKNKQFKAALDEEYLQKILDLA